MPDRGGPSPLMAGLLLFRGPVLHPIDHRVERCVQGIGNGPQTNGCWIQNTPFNATKVGALEAAIGTEPFLRKASLAPKLGHNDADGLFLGGSLAESGSCAVASKHFMVVRWRI